MRFRAGGSDVVICNGGRDAGGLDEVVCDGGGSRPVGGRGGIMVSMVLLSSMGSLLFENGLISMGSCCELVSIPSFASW
jgi:hypothetical protein